ncbi:hypothetical protein ONS96_010628 [Cadophora gregata f. sp. sojae]|nr:hypothetical protein ONS96_010628 [Cadophora gregata f. sp. sojae]
MLLGGFGLTFTALSIPTLASAQDFSWRAYKTTVCNHNANPGDVWPSNSVRPNTGSFGLCYSLPPQDPWIALEIDHDFYDGPYAVITYCNRRCQGNASPRQKGKYCYTTPQPDCIISSFSVR